MLSRKIYSLIDGLISQYDLFEKGWLYQEHIIEEGITDSYRNYFYFRKNGDKTTQASLEGGCDQYRVSGRYYMIVGLEPCVDTNIVLTNLYAYLNSKFVDDITGYNDDYEEVYESETGVKLTDDCKFIRIDMTIYDEVKLSCAPDLCRENCCNTKENKILNNSI